MVKSAVWILGSAVLAAVAFLNLPLLRQLPAYPLAAAGLLALAGVPFLWGLLGRKRAAAAAPETSGEGSLMLYPRSRQDPAHGKETEPWRRDLLQYGFAEAGKYVVYSQEFGRMSRTRAAADGFANAKETMYACIFTDADGKSSLELFTPYADGTFFICGSPAGTAALFSERTPRQKTIDAGGRAVMDMLDLAAKNRPGGDMLPVTPEAFRTVYMRREQDCRAWQAEHLQEIGRIDAAVREELYREAPRLLTNPQTIAMQPESFVIIHDRLSRYDLLLAVALCGGSQSVMKHIRDDVWETLSPRELFRHAAEQKWTGPLKPLLTTEEPVPADVYQRGGEDV